MTKYTVIFVRSARKELEALDASTSTRIIRKIEELAKNPRPSGCRKLQNEDKLWRIRIGDYRVIYEINDHSRTLYISVIRHRREVYR